MANIGFVIAGIVVGFFIWLFVGAALLLLGAKITGIVGRTYGKAIVTTVLSGIASLVLAFLLHSMPIVSAVLGFFGGFLITALIMIPIFKTTFGKALGAAALAGVFSILLFIGPAGIIAAIMIPAVSKALTSAAMVSTVANGHNIYRSAFANQFTTSMPGDNGNLPFPKVGEYSTSTEYFIHLVESGVMNVGYDFFAAKGIPGAKSMDPRDFKAENNAWCVVLGLEDAPEGTPFMFTRNCDINTLQSGDGPIVLTDEPPFGKDGMVVILKGGSAFTLRGDQLRNSFFNPAQTPSGANLTIIRP